jgi:hypothetical protein
VWTTDGYYKWVTDWENVTTTGEPYTFTGEDPDQMYVMGQTVTVSAGGHWQYEPWGTSLFDIPAGSNRGISLYRPTMHGRNVFFGLGYSLNACYAGASWTGSITLLFDSQGNVGLGFSSNYGPVSELLNFGASQIGTGGVGTIYTAEDNTASYSGNFGTGPNVGIELSGSSASLLPSQATLSVGGNVGLSPLDASAGPSKTKVLGFNLFDLVASRLLLGF